MDFKKGIWFFSFLILAAKSNCSGFFTELDQADTIIQKIQNSSLRVLKYNPIQVLTGEIPLSLEVFKGENESIQYQIGILIPIFRGTPGYIFPSPTTNLISIRTMPYYSYGISAKIELRTYKTSKYFAIQGMYKYSAYNNVSFRIWDSDPVYESFNQIESKSSHIIGLGLMFGSQRYNGKAVRDKYMGFGVRLRVFDGVIKARQFGSPRGRVDINEEFNYSSVYPYVNIGIRFGRTFPEKQN